MNGSGKSKKLYDLTILTLQRSSREISMIVCLLVQIMLKAFLVQFPLLGDIAYIRR